MGELWGCLLWVFLKNITALWRHRTAHIPQYPVNNLTYVLLFITMSVKSSLVIIMVWIQGETNKHQCNALCYNTTNNTTHWRIYFNGKKNLPYIVYHKSRGKIHYLAWQPGAQCIHAIRQGHFYTSTTSVCSLSCFAPGGMQTSFL